MKMTRLAAMIPAIVALSAPPAHAQADEGQPARPEPRMQHMHRGMMQDMMEDRKTMRQMCQQMAQHPEMMRMICEEMMTNPEGMRIMCEEMMKSPEGMAMCREKMQAPSDSGEGAESPRRDD